SAAEQLRGALRIGLEAFAAQERAARVDAERGLARGAARFEKSSSLGQIARPVLARARLARQLRARLGIGAGFLAGRGRRQQREEEDRGHSSGSSRTLSMPPATQRSSTRIHSSWASL